MKINYLVMNPQSLQARQNILYAPELKVSEVNGIMGEFYPAIILPGDSSDPDEMIYPFISSEILGECEEYERHPDLGVVYSWFGGKEGLERKFNEMHNAQTRKIAAAALGRLGGSAKTEAKKRASAENGKKGGRPKKQPKED